MVCFLPASLEWCGKTLEAATTEGDSSGTRCLSAQDGSQQEFTTSTCGSLSTFPSGSFFGVANIYEHCANDSPMHEEKVVDGSAFRGSFHKRPLVGVSRPRSWSRLLVLGAILREIVFKT